MQNSRPPELMDRLREYLESEILSRRKAGEGKLMLSKLDFAALMRLYKCALKNAASLEGLKNSGDKDISQSVQFILKVLNIKDFAGLKEWASKINRYAETLAKIESEGKKSVARPDFFALVRLKDLDGKKARYILLAVMSLFCDMCSDDFSPKHLLAEYITIIHPRHTKPLYDMLLLTLAPKRSDTDETSDSEKQKDSSAPQASEISALVNQIDMLKAELEGAYIRLNSSEENYDILQNEGKEAAMNEVLRLMNSREAGMLIDNFAKCETDMKNLFDKGIKLPEEYSSISLCVRIFMRTMRKIFGVEPVSNIGDILEINLDQSEKYICGDLDFKDSEEVKKVKVISPGWKRNDEIFSLPKVMEC